MKIDRKNPKHWLILAVSGVMLVFALPFRAFRKNQSKSVILFGHKLNGNLLPFYEYGLNNSNSKYTFFYLSVDPDYLKSLSSKPKILSGLNFFDMIKVVKADAIITDHGTLHFSILKHLSSIKFIDVWHGIPYKGFDHNTFKKWHDYDEIWVSSPHLKKLYTSKFGFKADKVKVVGYARVERMLNHPLSRSKILDMYGLQNKKTVLIAPTWEQDDSGRSIVPFGLNLEEFISTISNAAQGAQIIFRAHLNVKDANRVQSFGNVKIMPYADYPVGEDFLAVSDVLISDWSSIVFDFLALGRPVIFLDVPAPFKLGFSLGPEHRFGVVVKDANGLKEAVSNAFNTPEKFQHEHKEIYRKTLDVAYGNTLDGDVIKRSVERLDDLTA